MGWNLCLPTFGRASRMRFNCYQVLVFGGLCLVQVEAFDLVRAIQAGPRFRLKQGKYLLVPITRPCHLPSTVGHSQHRRQILGVLSRYSFDTGKDD